MATPSLSLNPLLGRVKLPGKVFQLPSKGLFYDKGVLADTVIDGEIHVRPMSALTEIKLRSADLLFSNKIIEEVCAECSPEILRPSLLLTKDIDALFLFMVISTYGSQKTISSLHTCAEAKPHDYNVNLETIVGNPNNQVLDHRDVLYSVDLPNGQVVLLKPINFLTNVTMTNLRQSISEQDKDAREISGMNMEKLVIEDLLAVIKGAKPDATDAVVITDQILLREWIKVLPRKFVELIVDASNRASDWGFKFRIELSCKDCGQTYAHDMELNPINFFTG